MRRLSSFRRFGLTLALAGSIVALATAAASGKPPGGGGVTEIKRFSVAVSDAIDGDSTVPAGTVSLKVTLRNDATSNTDLGSANVTISPGFTGATILGVTSSPAGKNWGPGPTLTHISGNTIQFRSFGSSDKLSAGQTVTATIQATAACGSWTWDTNSAKQSNDYNGGGNDFTYFPAGTYSTIDVNGCPDHLVISPEPGTTDAGQTISAGGTVTARVEDAQNNLVTSPSNQVDVTISAPTGVSLLGDTTVTSVLGIATFPDLAITRTGVYALTASSGSLTPDTSASFTVTPAAPDHLSVLAQPTDTPLGEAINDPNGVQVEILDRFDNRVDTNDPGDQRSIGASITPGTGTPGATLGGATTVTSAAGIATFSALVLDRIGQGYTLDFSDATSAGGLNGLAAATGTTSEAFDVTAGYAVALRVGTLQSGGSFIDNVPSHLLGTPIDIVVKTVDVDGNLGAPVRPGSDVQVQLAMRVEATTCNPGCTTSFSPYRVGPASLAPGGANPFLTLPTKLLHPGDTQLTFGGIIYPVQENSIVATASTVSPVSPSPSFLSEGRSPPFDTLAVLAKGNSATTTIGTANSSGAPCVDTTVQDNTCVTFYLDNGTNGSFYVEEGACQISPVSPCSYSVHGALVALLPDTFQSTLDSGSNDLLKYPVGSPQCPAVTNTQPCPRYTATHPARGVIEWDKSISGNQGAPKPNFYYSFGSVSALLLAQDCTVKGIINPGVNLCINSRNRQQGSGDTVYEFLFKDDLFTRKG